MNMETQATIKMHRPADPQCQICIKKFVNDPKNRIARPKTKLINDPNSDTGETVVPVVDDDGKPVMETVMPDPPRQINCQGHWETMTENQEQVFLTMGWVRA